MDANCNVMQGTGSLWPVVRKHYKFLLVICILASFLRALFFVGFLQYGQNAWLAGDSREYTNVGLQIARGNGISMAPGVPNFHRLPAYPCFLAVGYRLFDEQLNYVLFMQAILGGLLPLFMFCMSLMLIPNAIRIAQVVALASAVHMGFLGHAGMVATETLCLFFLITFFILFLPAIPIFNCRAIRAFSWKRFLLAGLLLGVIAVTRAIGHYMLLLSLLLLLLSRLSWPQKFKAGSALSIGWLATAGWWLLRNFLLTGCIFFHTLPGFHFLRFWGVPTVVRAEQRTYFDVCQQLNEERDQEIARQEKLKQSKLNPYELCCVSERIGLTYAKKYPFHAAMHAAAQLVKTCVEPFAVRYLIVDAPADFECYAHGSFMTKLRYLLAPNVSFAWLIPLIYFELLFIILMLLGCLFFAVGMVYGNELFRCVFIRSSPFIGMLIFITLAYGCARLRLPIEPFLLIFSVSGWFWLFKRMQAKPNGQNSI